MKMIFFCASVLIFLATTSLQGQYDSVYTYSDGVISVNVKEVSEDAIKFSYPNEELLNTISKNDIQKIVFNSGRVQILNERIALNKITGFHDWEKVTVTSSERDVQGLYRIGEMDVDGKSYKEDSKVIKDQNYDKMKKQAALQGASIVLIVEGEASKYYFGVKDSDKESKKSKLSGITFTDILPDYSKFLIQIEGKATHLTRKVEFGYNSKKSLTDPYYSNRPIILSNPEKRENFIFVFAEIPRLLKKELRVTYFSEDRIVLMEEFNGTYINYNLKIE